MATRQAGSRQAGLEAMPGPEARRPRGPEGRGAGGAKRPQGPPRGIDIAPRAIRLCGLTSGLPGL